MQSDPDDIVDEWHDGPDERTFSEFMANRLGWTVKQVQHWAATGQLPEGGIDG
jgi:hypothetical protein